MTSVTMGDATTVEPPTRRERMRAATMAEIAAEARSLLAAEGVAGVSLRAVARRMGLTPAALYRYVDSHEQLLALMSVEIHRDLVVQLRQARDAVPENRPGQRLLAISREFRDWALAQPHDFGLVFANPMQAAGHQPATPLEEAAVDMGGVFAEAFGAALQHGQIPVPDLVDVDPLLLEAVAGYADLYGLPDTALVRFVQCWTRLYGCVSLEVSGHLCWAMSDTQAIFDLTLRECAQLIGLRDDGD